MEQPLHVLFFPFMAPGHMNPMVDIAKLFSHHGVKATILTTPANASLIQPTIDRANSKHNSHPINITLIPFPSTKVGLPKGCENYYNIPSYQPNAYETFLKATSLLRQSFDQVLTDLTPHCVVTDMFLRWTDDVAAAHGVPRIVFHGTSSFALCDPDTFGHGRDSSLLGTEYMEPRNARDELGKCFGVLVNSFYSLEPEYAEHYREMVGRNVWHVGPASICNEDEEDMRQRGGNSADCESCLQWLDSKAPGSVLYVSFGSLSDMSWLQLRQIAFGLEASNRPFIWVVKDGWLPWGFEKRTKGRGLIIRKWAPQVLILNHTAVGGFITHCGWNSCLEAVSAGVPMITWPLFGDQFNNERLMVDVLGVGVSLGVTHVVLDLEITVKAAELKKAVEELMGDEEDSENRRWRAKLLSVEAGQALSVSGSSYADIQNLIKALKRWWRHQTLSKSRRGGRRNSSRSRQGYSSATSTRKQSYLADASTAEKYLLLSSCPTEAWFPVIVASNWLRAFWIECVFLAFCIFGLWLILSR